MARPKNKPNKISVKKLEAFLKNRVPFYSEKSFLENSEPIIDKKEEDKVNKK